MRANQARISWVKLGGWAYCLFLLIHIAWNNSAKANEGSISNLGPLANVRAQSDPNFVANNAITADCGVRRNVTVRADSAIVANGRTNIQNCIFSNFTARIGSCEMENDGAWANFCGRRNVGARMDDCFRCATAFNEPLKFFFSDRAISDCDNEPEIEQGNLRIKNRNSANLIARGMIVQKSVRPHPARDSGLCDTFAVSACPKNIKRGFHSAASSLLAGVSPFQNDGGFVTA